MKTFAEYLTESKKTYEFKVGVAGELPEGFADHMETALQKYGVMKMSAGKSTPIQERPLDFPQLRTPMLHTTKLNCNIQPLCKYYKNI